MGTDFPQVTAPITSPFALLGLPAELRELDSRHPGWHCWTSDTGIVHAATCRCSEAAGCGTTIEARTAALMDYEIAMQEHQWRLAGVIA